MARPALELRWAQPRVIDRVVVLALESDTTLYTSLVIIHTKYAGWRQNDFYD